MSASPILREIYREHIAHFGEPSDSVSFGDGKRRAGYPDRIDVLIWDANEKCDMTTFATIGMASLQMPKANYRAELHFAVRKTLTQKHKHEVARFLANLAVYPFQINEPIDWWHTVANPGKIPLFVTTECLLLHPRFVKEGWDSISTTEVEIHILNAIPITLAEKELREIPAILKRLSEVDMFEPR